ncbi:conjugal transfer protein [Streptomyces sp. HNM0574]|uniref:conjugal transfer protein n=1 Tax=Streptomyces sp. HNM0574 TaxID=2714954 RepID=UPI00146D85FF|nr:conjugal transfer protein [Streptomyces sp. HNM0574]NLU68479.1 conjugal transfer protein [Streptomyces sp. HNM0574]
MSEGNPLSTLQKIVLGLAFAPMLATGVAGGIGTFSNISAKYGEGTAVGAVAAGEGATAVLALVLLGLTMLGQSSPLVIRIGLWVLPAAASAMACTAATDLGQAVIYAVTPMGMTVSAEGMAFLARRIVVHQDGRDAEAEERAAALVRELAYHRACAANHPDEDVRAESELKSWKLARKVGSGDSTLGGRLLEIQRERVTGGANAALQSMFTPGQSADEPSPTEAAETTEPVGPESTPELEESAPPAPALAVARAPLALPEPVDPVKPVEPPRARATVPAESTRPRRATTVVPDAAKSTRPRRTPDQLLTEARKLTADWSTEELTAEAIRKAVRTSAEKARGLRETLRAERAEGKAAA